MIRKTGIICITLIILFSICTRADILYVGTGQEFNSITEAVASGSDGDEIIISGGIYDENIELFPIEPEKSLYIHAAEGEAVTIRSPLTFVAMKVKGAGSRIEGINFEFTRSAGMHVLADDVIIDNCRFELGDTQWRETSCGMWIGGSKNVTVSNTEFINSSIAIAGPPVTAPSSEVPVLTALFEVGEDPEFFTTHTIENCLSNGKPIEYLVGLKDQEYSSDAGQIIAACCENVSFMNLDVSCASIGVQMAYSSKCSIIDSTANDCGIFGIYVAKCDDCKISNVTANNGGHGIDTRGCSRCIVENCTSNECGQGVFVVWDNDCIVTNCQILNNGTGLYASRGSDNLIENCKIGENQLGLYMQNTKFKMTGTDVFANTSCGLRTSDSEVEVIDNTFTDNLVGSLILDSPASVYSGNTFSGSEINDLYFKNCTGMDYDNNEFSPDLEENIVIE